MTEVMTEVIVRLHSQENILHILIEEMWTEE